MIELDQPSWGPANKNNRRRFTRVRTRQLRSSIRSRRGDDADVWVADLSLGGALLRTDVPLPVGETLALELSRVAGGPLRLHSRVVSNCASGRPGMGVSFDSISPMTLVELRELIRALAPPGTHLEAVRAEEADRTVLAALPVAPPIPPVAMLTAAPPVPVEALPAPTPSVPRQLPRPISVAGGENQINVQVRKLLMQIGELEVQLGAKNREISGLQDVIRELRASNAALRRG